MKEECRKQAKKIK